MYSKQEAQSADSGAAGREIPGKYEMLRLGGNGKWGRPMPPAVVVHAW